MSYAGFCEQCGIPYYEADILLHRHLSASQVVGKVLSSKLDELENRIASIQTDAPTCRNCGTIMQPAGKCYACPCCGDSSGCS